MAWTAPKTWSVGETLTAANFNTHIRDNLLAVGPHLIARKTSDQTVSNTTLTALTTLTLSVAANEVWRVEFFLLMDTSQASDSAFRFTFPTGGETSFATWEVNESGGYGGQQIWGDTTSPGGSTNVAGHTTKKIPLVITGIYANGANAGTLGMDFALATASGGSTIAKTNSTLWAVKLV